MLSNNTHTHTSVPVRPKQINKLKTKNKKTEYVFLNEF